MGSLALGNYANGLYGIFTSQSIFLRSNKVLEWQPGAPKSPGARFSKKKNVLLLKIIGPVTPLCVL